MLVTIGMSNGQEYATDAAQLDADQDDAVDAVTVVREAIEKGEPLWCGDHCVSFTARHVVAIAAAHGH